MKALPLALALLLAAPGRPTTGVVGVGAYTPEAPTFVIDGVYSNDTSTSTLSITGVSVPSGALVVFLATSYYTTGLASNGSLTFTNRNARTEGGSYGNARIDTAVNSGGALSNQTISSTLGGAGGAGTVVVLTGADTTSLTTTASAVQTGLTNFSQSITTQNNGKQSYVLAIAGQFNNSETAVPYPNDGTITELYDAGGAIWTGRSTNLLDPNTTFSIGCTWSTNRWGNISAISITSQ